MKTVTKEKLTSLYDFLEMQEKQIDEVYANTKLVFEDEHEETIALVNEIRNLMYKSYGESYNKIMLLSKKHNLSL